MERQIQIGIAQINPHVGNLAANAATIVHAVRQLTETGADWVVLPELALCGYPPEDLLLKQHFIDACRDSLQHVAAAIPEETVVFCGFPQPAPPHASDHRLAHNAAAILYQGRIQAVYTKHRLPNYDVFDEKRLFRPGSTDPALTIAGIRVAVHICEDSWFPQQESPLPGEAWEPEILINLSASPYHQGKWRQREAILSATGKRMGCPMVYTNLVGGQDELVFDGGSKVITTESTVLYRASAFTEALAVVAVPIPERSPLHPAPALPQITIDQKPKSFPIAPPPTQTEPPEPFDEVYQALVLGLGDYVRKNGFSGVLIALSGGIDSALAASIAVDALGPDAVRTFTMPSQYSSDETLSDAVLLAQNMGIEIDTLPIRGLYDAFMNELAPVWDDAEPGLAEENLQARIRGTLIMTLSNKTGRMVVSTGNKSELATGYCTLYGDMNGGFAVIKDVPKTLVFDLCRWRNDQSTSPWIPPSTIDRPPSAELRPDQKDTDSLPDYDVLDGILMRYVEQDQGADDIVAAGFDPDTVRQVLRLVDRSEYKRRQSPPGVRITPKAFGRDRRVPITNGFSDTPTQDPSA